MNGVSSPTTRGRLAIPAVFLVLLTAAVTAVFLRPSDPLDHQRDSGTPASGVERTVQATTTTRRHGAYYLPGNYGSLTLPLFVILHGTNGKGSLMMARLRPLADQERFIIVAPDSVSPAGVWEVGQRPEEVTEDYRHIMRCVREVMALPGVKVDPAHVLIAGYSIGGSAAPYVASHEDLFTAFAVLHGHVVPGGLGPRRVRGWFSTGTRDRLRTVEHVRSAAESMTRQEQVTEVELRVFPNDHALRQDELATLVAWWLRSGRSSGTGAGSAGHGRTLHDGR